MSQSAAWNEEYKVDVKFCMPFVEGVTHTLATQCNLTPKAGPPGFVDASNTQRYDVLIQASLSSDKTMATISICFPKAVFLATMGKMLEETYTEITPELEDGAKELMNIVFNQAKKHLSEKGAGGGLRSIPTVVFGSNMYCRYLSRSRPIFLTFNTEVGGFYVEMSTQTVSVSDKV